MTEEARNGFPRQYSDPTELGFNTARLNEVVAFARDPRSRPGPRTLRASSMSDLGRMSYLRGTR